MEIIFFTIALVISLGGVIVAIKDLGPKRPNDILYKQSDYKPERRTKWKMERRSN